MRQPWRVVGWRVSVCTRMLCVYARPRGVELEGRTHGMSSPRGPPALPRPPCRRCGQAARSWRPRRSAYHRGSRRSTFKKRAGVNDSASCGCQGCRAIRQRPRAAKERAAPSGGKRESSALGLQPKTRADALGLRQPGVGADVAVVSGGGGGATTCQEARGAGGDNEVGAHQNHDGNRSPLHDAGGGGLDSARSLGRSPPRALDLAGPAMVLAWVLLGCCDSTAKVLCRARLRRPRPRRFCCGGS